MNIIHQIKKKCNSSPLYIYVRALSYKLYIKSNKNPIVRKKIQILDKTSSIDRILENKKNLARFGDNEFSLINNLRTTEYQDVNKSLSERIQEVLDKKKENVEVAIPYNLINLDGKKVPLVTFWCKYVKIYGDFLAKIIPNNRTYLDADITRIYHPTFNKKLAKIDFDKIRLLWDNIDILFVEGRYTRNAIGNDLYSNAKSISRLLCPEKNAFDKYDQILEKIKEHGKDKIVLISLGPTATALAYELADYNIWALDMGHLDLEYMWYQMNAKKKIPIKGRFVNEANNVSEQNFELEGKDLEFFNKTTVDIIE